jgi:hypothetical protein
MGCDPLHCGRGERVSDWMASWRAAGLPVEGHPQPLAIGAFEQLIARLIAEACWLNRFKRLLGWPVAPVIAEHRVAAQQRLKARWQARGRWAEGGA